MLETFALYLLLLFTIGAGFLLGRRDGLKQQVGIRRQPPDNLHGYLTGLYQILELPQEQAIDRLLNSLADADGGLEARLALGALLRRRGETSKAIAVHQALLADPALAGEDRAWVELELARDHQNAGLLGRAENLLTQLLRQKGEVRTAALMHLVEIYEREQEWRQAVATGHQLLALIEGLAADRLRAALAHYHCELATLALSQSQLVQCRQQLQQARTMDLFCARACLLQAQLHLHQADYRQAQASLREAIELDPGLIEETLPLYQQCVEAQGQPEAYDRYLQFYLDQMAARQPGEISHMVITALYQRRHDSLGGNAAIDWLGEQLAQYPSAPLASFYLDQVLQAGGQADSRQLELLQHLSSRLQEEQKDFRCRACGFSARSLHWQCPSCRQWGTLSRRSPLRQPASFKSPSVYSLNPTYLG